MEISKGLQEEILSVQNKLKNAIRDHQICVGKLKDDPKNADILGQIQEIQLHIVSLGRCQKQVVQRLRKEVETFKAENKNGAKVSVASLLGLNNNNHITNNNEAGNDVSDVKDLNGLGRRSSKDDYEEVVEDGDVASSSPRHNERPKERSCSVETISGEDDVIEVSVDENSCEKREEDDVEEMGGEEGVIVDEEPCVIEPFQQLNFLGNLGLITTEKCTELQNKRAERKRRSTANPQFVYSNWEIPTKRKRHSYLQSAGNAPQTRQTTARLNGPSPPPGKVSSKTSSPSSRALTKSLIPTQKTTSRPNILRNAIESKVFVGKGKLDNGAGQTQLPSAKSVQSVGSKAVHIPGLPSSLTIERIENDTSVCISCRNPGTLAICERCSANYHISCHTISSPPPKTCPKCALRARSLEGGSPIGVKKDEELEERERERYELRERNSDLRLQVYELEKRSQLLGQSLQLQHRTRQELLGKQEKTQRSIKRLVDFIKLMQHKRDPISPQPSASTSFLPRPSSSRSPRTPSPPAASTNQKTQPSSLAPQAPKLSRHQKAASTTPPSSSTSCQSRTSPTLRQSPKCPTPTNCQSAASSRRNTSHISSSKKSETLPTAKESTTNQRQSPLAISRKVKTFPSSTSNCQQHHPGTTLVANRRSQSPVPPSCSAVSPTRSVASVKSPTAAQSPDSTESPIRKSSYQSCPPQTTSWNHQQRTTAESRKAGNRHAQISVSPAPQGTRKRSCLPVSSSSVQTPTDWRVGGESSRKKSAVPLRKTDQDRPIYSTRCSPAITSPISSPVVLTNNKTPPRANKIAQSPNNCLGTASPSSTSQLSLLQTQSDLEVPQPQRSPNT